jgi:hypothetical protein
MACGEEKNKKKKSKAANSERTIIYIYSNLQFDIYYALKLSKHKKERFFLSQTLLNNFHSYYRYYYLLILLKQKCFVSQRLEFDINL